MLAENLINKFSEKKESNIAEMGKSEVFKVQVKSSQWNKNSSQVKSRVEKKIPSQVKS